MNIFDEAELNRFYQYAYALTYDADDAFELVSATLKRWMVGEFDDMPEQEREDYFIELLRSMFFKWFDATQVEDSELETLDVLNLTIPNDLEISNKIEDLSTYLQELTAKEREVLYLWSVQNLNAEEISKFLNMKKGKIIAKILKIHTTIKDARLKKYE